MKIEIGILKSRITTDNPELFKTLRDLYRHKVKGSEYSPAYKNGTWDGKKEFITKAGYFRTGLLDRVLRDLGKIDCAPDLIWKLVDVEKEEEILYIEHKLGEYELRDYQKELVSEGLLKLRAVVKSPTGSGKTLIMAAMLKALKGKKVVIVFNAKQLIVQTYEFLEKCGIPNVGICFGEGYKYGDIMLTTVNSIEQVLDSHSKEAEVLMVDECHAFAGGTRNLVAIEGFENARYRIGFTATPPIDTVSKYSLEGALGPVIEAENTKSLIDKNYLSRPIIQIFPVENEEDLSNLSYEKVYEKHITKNPDRNNLILGIINHIKKSNKKARILILTQQLAHAGILNELIENSYKLEGYDHVSTRYDTIKKFLDEKETSVLIGTKILQSGVNIEQISHFINARGWKSEIATLQALGRALRKHDSKLQVYIYDFYDKVKYLEKHSKDRIKAYKKEKHEVKIL